MLYYLILTSKTHKDRRHLFIYTGLERGLGMQMPCQGACVSSGGMPWCVCDHKGAVCGAVQGRDVAEDFLFKGANFESGLFQEICTLLRIKKTRTTAFMPCNNGLV